MDKQLIEDLFVGNTFGPIRFEKVFSHSEPHPYMIGPRHVATAADHYGGMLGESAIEGAEKSGVTCYWQENGRGPKCQVPYDQHETTHVIMCNTDEGALVEDDWRNFADFIKGLFGDRSDVGIGFKPVMESELKRIGIWQ